MNMMSRHEIPVLITGPMREALQIAASLTGPMREALSLAASLIGLFRPAPRSLPRCTLAKPTLLILIAPAEVHGHL